MRLTSPLLLLFSLFYISTFGQTGALVVPANPEKWADSILSSLSLDQKIGQLFMVPAYSHPDTDPASVESLIRNQQIGGLIFMQGEPAQQVRFANHFQSLSNIPLLISQDAEWGINMRLRGPAPFPHNMTLGAIRNDSLIYQMGAQLARECSRVGVQVNFAPVVDVNNNAKNPVINDRSFGENKYNVARKGIMIAKGMQDYGLMACAKHFPGHGDTGTDSHLDLPVISHSRERLDSVELYPFRKMMEADVQSVMVAHLYVPELDATPNLPTTLSPRVVDGLLRNEMGFEGLVFTDALNMKGVTKFFNPGEADLLALLAGNDVLLFSQEVPKAIEMIRAAVLAGRLSMDELEVHVKRILTAKARLGLMRWQPLPETNVLQDLHTLEGRILRKKLYEAALTLVQNKAGLIPLKQLEARNIAYVQIGDAGEKVFLETLEKYAPITTFKLGQGFSEGQVLDLVGKLRDFDTIILGVFGMNRHASRNYGVNPNTVLLSKRLKQEGKQLILSLFGNPYSVKYFGIEDAILVAYEEDPFAQQATASAIFGGLKVSGRLPVSPSPEFPAGTGVEISYISRFGFSIPEEQGMDSRSLLRIDSLAQHYINLMATPGCAILVMKGNQIVYDKGFGKTAYGENGLPVDPYRTTYDLASITKVAATTMVTMHLVEQGKLDLDRRISSYLPDLKNTNKANLTVRRLLQHNAGLPPFIRFYADTYSDPENHVLDPKFYSYTQTSQYNLPIGPGLYGNENLKDTIWQKIIDLEVRNTTKVRYSDIGMVIMSRIIEKVTGQGMDAYARQAFYRPMGMNNTRFSPAISGDALNCPPTEVDTSWRFSEIKGYVHDPTAAILGGYAGHAGLFSNVYDLAKLMLMVKNGGSYGNYAFFSKETVRDFTRKQLRDNRRGLGWDKPDPDRSHSQPASESASLDTYGHLGFTGTAVWTDPVYDLIFVFLSNRTYPYSSNRLLVKESVRTKAMDLVYTSLFTFQGNNAHKKVE
jgi:beta-glucosidase-like glycosyl hydrolase/CubicO group peptidase (beta-lactamase class C family)